MNDRIFQKAGDTSVTATVWLEDATTGALKTSVTIADLDYKYIRVETDNDVTITSAANVVALSALTDAHADGKMLEIGEGAYRLDIPDAMIAAGANYAQIVVWDAAGDTILPCVLEIQLLSVPVDVQSWFGTAVTLSDNNKPDVNIDEISDDTTAPATLELIVENAKGADHKLLISTDAQDLSATFDVNTKLVVGATPITLAQINAEADTALSDANLDHLMKTAVANNADMTAEVPDGTVLSNIMSAGGDTSDFVPSTDSLESIGTPIAGALEITYTVKEDDEDTGDPIDGVEVWITTDIGGSNVIWSGTTNASGVLLESGGSKPWLDAGTYYFWRKKSGFIFTNPDTETFS